MSSPACPACGYDLRTQSTESGARCPECGTEFTFEEIAPKGLWRAHVQPYLSRWMWLLLPAVTAPPLTLVAMLWIGFNRWYIDP